MNAAFSYNLKLPCRNRGIKIVISDNSDVTLDGKPFDTQAECERYIESKPRLDFGKIKSKVV